MVYCHVQGEVAFSTHFYLGIDLEFGSMNRYLVDREIGED